jgi:hypothetical protein
VTKTLSAQFVSFRQEVLRQLSLFCPQWLSYINIHYTAYIQPLKQTKWYLMCLLEDGTVVKYDPNGHHSSIDSVTYALVSNVYVTYVMKTSFRVVSARYGWHLANEGIGCNLTHFQLCPTSVVI